MSRLVLMLIVFITAENCFSLNAYGGERLSADLLFPVLVRTGDQTEGVAPLLSDKIRDIRLEFGKLVATFEKMQEAVPAQYEEAFFEYGRQLNEVSTNASSPATLRVAQELLEDLQFKNKYITGGFGFSPRSKFLVSLKVTTKNRAGETANGYHVTCNPRRFAGTRRPLFPFGQLTSPAQQFVPPGIYSLEISRNGELVTTSEVTVGMSGEDEENVQVAIDEVSSR